jgi:hypothetical protein
VGDDVDRRDRGERLEVDRQDAPQTISGDAEGEPAADLSMFLLMRDAEVR